VKRATEIATDEKEVKDLTSKLAEQGNDLGKNLSAEKKDYFIKNRKLIIEESEKGSEITWMKNSWCGRPFALVDFTL